jgi:hypothetical protein
MKSAVDFGGSVLEAFISDEKPKPAAKKSSAKEHDLGQEGRIYDEEDEVEW